jgi:hypothetical protein
MKSIPDDWRKYFIIPTAAAVFGELGGGEDVCFLRFSLSSEEMSQRVGLEEEKERRGGVDSLRTQTLTTEEIVEVMAGHSWISESPRRWTPFSHPLVFVDH